MPSPHPFTYGDRIRRRRGGPVVAVRDITPTHYELSDGTILLTADADCYTLVERASGYFLVADSIATLPLADHLQHGYEERRDFADALRRLIDRWGGRTGQHVGTRHGFLRLLFRDVPGGTEECWLPLYMLTPCPMPDYLKTEEEDPIIKELDDAFGFDWWKE